MLRVGRAMTAPSSASQSTCLEKRGRRIGAPSPTIDPLDYLECYSTATSTFVTKGVSTSFNDQVVKITVAEIVPKARYKKSKELE